MHKLRFLIRRARRVLEVYGWRGAVLAGHNLRARSTVRAVPVPGTDFRLTARLGRRESDLQTLIHVFHGAAYDFGVSSAAVIIDAGANAGYSAVWFAMRFPDARVIAIEPAADNVTLLRSNTAHLPNVSVVPAALLGFDGEARLVDPQQGPWAIRVQRDDNSWSGGIPGEKVACVSVGGLIEAFDIDRIDLLKMDIEGSEVDVLDDCAGWMPRVDAVVAELHDRFRVGCTEAFERATVGFAHRRHRGEDTFASRAAV